MTTRRHWSANCSLLFTEYPLLDRPAAAAAAGFEAIELWWPFDDAVPEARAVDAFVDAVRDAGVRLTGLNFAAGDMPGGDRGLVSWPGREEEFRANVDVVVDIGRRLAVPAFNALYGNRVEGVPAAEQDALAARNLTHAARAAAGIDAVVLVEPVSGAPDYPLRLAADAVAVIERVEREHDVANLRLLADLYHLAVNGDDVEEVIGKHADLIGHVQIADAPGRHEPGSGQLPLARHLADLHTHGYAGWVGLEYQPSTRTHDTLAWMGELQ